MKISAEKDQQSQYVIRIEIEPEELNGAKVKAAKRLSNRLRIPGFRPGKAPQALVERFVGQEALLEEATRDLMPKAFEEALKKEDIKPIGDPDVKIESNDPLTIVATVPVEPTVTLGDYSTIKLEAPQVEVNEQEVNEVLQQLIDQNSTWEEPAEERVAQDGDQIEIDLQALRDGELSGEATTRSGVLGQHELLEQIEQQVVGMKVGEEKTIEVKRDQKAAEAEGETTEGEAENTEAETENTTTAQAEVQPGDNIEEGLGEVKAEIASGADVPEVETIPLEPEEAATQAKTPLQFHVKLNSVKEKHAPALDDDFAASVSDLKTLDELTKRVRENLLRQKQSEANRELTEKFVEQAVAQSTIEVSPYLVNQQIHLLEENLGQRLRQQKLSVDQYLSITGKSHDEFHEELRPQAEEQLRNQLVLMEIAKAENVEVSEAEIDAEVGKLVDQYTTNAPEETREQQANALRELYNRKEMRDNITNELFSRKLGERIIEMSTGIKPDSEQMQAAEASDADLDLELKPTADPNLASEASDAKEDLEEGLAGDAASEE